MKTGFVITAGVLAFLAMPLAAQAQGIVEGGAAGPVGAAVGGVRGALGVPRRQYQNYYYTQHSLSTETTLRASANILRINIATMR